MRSPTNTFANRDDWHLALTLQTQIADTSNHHTWKVREHHVTWRAAETAIIVVDMWDRHWSRGASERVDLLAPRIDQVITSARRQGVLIIHAPSDVVATYTDHPARQVTLAAPHVDLPPLEHNQSPPLPIDDSDEGSDTGETQAYVAWSRQHAAIAIEPTDAISDTDQEIINLLHDRQIRHLIYMGVHLNRCVLHRPFGIKRMRGWGFDVALARDLTDTMYNPLRSPYVSHQAGTDLVVNYIEKFWCPTLASRDLLMT